MRGLSGPWSLLLSLLVPIAGVLFFDWNLFAIIYLFWIQLIALGFLSIIGILFSISGERYFFSIISNIPYALFFTIIYGGLLLIVLSYSMVSFDFDIALEGGENSHLGLGLLALLSTMFIEFVRAFFVSGYFKKAHPLGEIYSTMIASLPLAIVLLFVVIPLSEKYSSSWGNKILVIGIIILKGLLDFYLANIKSGLYKRILKS